MITQFDAVLELEEVDWDLYDAGDRFLVSEARKTLAAIAAQEMPTETKGNHKT